MSKSSPIIKNDIIRASFTQSQEYVKIVGDKLVIEKVKP
jgi:hypothetical protein